MALLPLPRKAHVQSYGSLGEPHIECITYFHCKFNLKYTLKILQNELNYWLTNIFSYFTRCLTILNKEGIGVGRK